MNRVSAACPALTRLLAVGAFVGAPTAGAATPDWVREVDGQTEICAVAIDDDPNEAKPPPLTALQDLRRAVDPAALGAPITAPALSTLGRALGAEPAAIALEIAPHPVRPGWSIARVEAAVAPLPTAVEQHITIAVDTSASMSSASFRGIPLLLDEPPPELGAYRTVGRLDLTRQVLHELVDALAGDDQTVAIVAFHREYAVSLLDPTPVANKAAMHAAIDRIDASAVRGDDLMGTLYRTAAKAFTACADDRVLLFTDENPQIRGAPADVEAGVRAWATQGLALHAFAVATTADLMPIARLTAAGGGELQRVDTVAEALDAIHTALRPTGSPVAAPRVEVRLPGRWRVDGRDGEGASHVWALPEPMVSDWSGVAVYEFDGDPSGASAQFAGQSPVPGEWSRTWVAGAKRAAAFSEASMALRHDAAYRIAEIGLREPAQRAAAAAALAAAIREVGPGREAQALLHRAP